MDITFQYPPDLFALLVDAIPKLCKSKQDLLTFFQGAGVEQGILIPHQSLFASNRDAFKKIPVTRDVLTKLNTLGEKGLRERREVLKRVSVCWDKDQPVVKGLVAQIRELVLVKDTFTRINLEREQERKERLAEKRQKENADRKSREELEKVKQSFFSLFAETNPVRRGKLLEDVLNRYFKISGILVSESITLTGDAGAGIIEQIDGVVQLRGQLFLVEVKWEKETLGRDKVAPHLVRVFSRGFAGGLFISYSDYSEAAFTDCKDALREKVIVLCRLNEFVHALEEGIELQDILNRKIDAAVISKNPFHNPF